MLNTQHARAMLLKRYAAPEWALLEEVAPATGGGTRYADAIAVNLWQSRGHAIHGFEIKVSRGDWLRELKQPEKAEPLYRYCDHWTIVAPRGIVKDGELPSTWGLLELRKTGLVQIVASPRLEAQPITRAFFASLMRRGHEQLDRMASNKVQHAINESRRIIDERVEEQVKRRTREIERSNDAMAKFTAETGLTLDPWGGPPIKAIKLAQRLELLSNYDGGQALGRLTNLANDLERALGVLRKAITDTELDETPTPPRS